MRKSSLYYIAVFDRPVQCTFISLSPTIFHLFAKTHWGSLPLTDLANGQVPWHGDDLVVRTDYGLFVDPLTGYQNRPNRQEFEESIDGQPARVVAFDQADGSRLTAAHFYDLGRLGAAPKKLTFVVIGSGGRTADEALRITRSIRFRR